MTWGNDFRHQLLLFPGARRRHRDRPGLGRPRDDLVHPWVLSDPAIRQRYRARRGALYLIRPYDIIAARSTGSLTPPAWMTLDWCSPSLLFPRG